MTRRRQRGVYDNMDYRDVTSVKANGIESPQSEHYRSNMRYENNLNKDHSPGTFCNSYCLFYRSK